MLDRSALDTGWTARRPALIGSVSVGLLAAPGLYLIDPSSTHVPLCPLHAMTGLWCPLCGVTRACHALLHGQLGLALQDNLLFVLLLPVLAVGWWRWTAGQRRLLPRPVSAMVLVLAICFGVLRNLPAGSWLAPPG